MNPAAGPTTSSAPKASLYGLGVSQQDLEARISALLDGLDDPDCPADLGSELTALLEQEAANKDALLSKADAYCAIAEKLNLQAKGLRDVAASRLAYAQALEKRAERLESTLIEVLTRLNPGATKFELAEHRLSSRTVTVIDDSDLDPDQIPEDLMRIKREPDKTLIKAALKAGQDIPGLRLMQRTSWSIK